METEKPKELPKGQRRAARAAELKKVQKQQQELEQRRQLGELQPPPKTSKTGGVLIWSHKSRGNVLYTMYTIIGKFTPSTQPSRNPARELRRSYGPMSGKQWERLRRDLQRMQVSAELSPALEVSRAEHE
jgi:hypothetical protein